MNDAWKQEALDADRYEARKASFAKRSVGQRARTVYSLGSLKRKRIAYLYGRGCDTEEIAKQFQITPETVRNIACKEGVGRPKSP